jgi:hypothetical protein
MRPVTVLDVLLGVAALLDSDEHYTKRSGTDAADEHNQPCGYMTARAVKFSLFGACKRSARDLGVGMKFAEQHWYWDALRAVERHLPQVPSFTPDGALLWYTEPRGIPFPTIKDAISAAIADQPADAWSVDHLVAS